MSLKKLQQVKEDKGFKIFDLIVYALVVVLIVVLFTVFVFTKDSQPLEGVGIYVKNEQIFTYIFADDEYSIKSESVTILSNDDNKMVVRIVTGEDGEGYNDVEINKSGVWVKVIDANCSPLSKDCVRTAKISDNQWCIYCLPHALSVMPYGYTPEVVDGELDM
jgi:hypothetical protein